MCESGPLEDKIDTIEDLDLEFDFGDDELEEGEFIPEDITDWDYDKEEMQDHDDDAQEHILPPVKVTEVVGDTSVNEKNEELNEVRSTINQNNQADPGIDVVESDTENEHLKQTWFKDVPEKMKIVYKEHIETTGDSNLKKGIISWFFDNELQLFVLKRFDGLQYLENKLSVFNSLPYLELKELAKKSLINRGNDQMAEVMVRIIKREVLSRKFDQLKPSFGKRMIHRRNIDPITNRPSVRVVYQPVKCLKKVPLKKMPQDVLESIRWWYVDKDTGEAVMQNEEYQELLRVYDPLHLVNLSKKDLFKLNELRLLCMDIWREEAQKYKKVVRVCVEKDVHARCKKV